jgi:hypothetical protein
VQEILDLQIIQEKMVVLVVEQEMEVTVEVQVIHLPLVLHKEILEAVEIVITVDQVVVEEELLNQDLMVQEIPLHQLWEMVEMEQQQVLMVHLQLLQEAVAQVVEVVFLPEE